MKIEVWPGPVAVDCSGVGTPRDQEKQSRLSQLVHILQTEYPDRVELVIRDIFDDAHYSESLYVLRRYLRQRGDEDLADRVAFSVRQVTPAIAVDGELRYVGNAPAPGDFFAELRLDEKPETSSTDSLLIFPSAHHLLRAEQALVAAGIDIELVPAPRRIEEPCATAIRFLNEQLERVRETLKEKSVLINDIVPFSQPRVPRRALSLESTSTDVGVRDLVGRIMITMVEPCYADQEKIRLFAQLPEDVRELLPYLNAKLANATYVAERDTLTFMKGGRLVTVYPRRVSIAKADDLADAEQVLEWLAERINFVHAHRDEIEPVTERRVHIGPLDIYSWLPQTNCRECGEVSCLAFALLLLQEKHRLADCRPLYTSADLTGQRQRLKEFAEALGMSTQGDA